MIQKSVLEKLYTQQKFSSAQIAFRLGVGISTVNYYLQKYSIKKRSISDAVYAIKNPKGDPFVFKAPLSKEEYFLYGLGMGLYWGEGTKKSKIVT